MALNNSKPLIFISSLGPRVDEADDDDERAQGGGRNFGCGCVGKMTLESSGNFGYFVWLLGQTERAPEGAWRSDRNCSKCGHVQLAADK